MESVGEEASRQLDVTGKVLEWSWGVMQEGHRGKGPLTPEAHGTVQRWCFLGKKEKHVSFPGRLRSMKRTSVNF